MLRSVASVSERWSGWGTLLRTSELAKQRVDHLTHHQPLLSALIAQRRPYELVHHLRVGSATGFLHDLPHEEPE